MAFSDIEEHVGFTPTANQTETNLIVFGRDSLKSDIHGSLISGQGGSELFILQSLRVSGDCVPPRHPWVYVDVRSISSRITTFKPFSYVLETN